MVNATDADTDTNAKVRYAIINPMPGFSIGENSGIIYANTSRLSKTLKQDIQLSISATDSGVPALKTVTSVRIHIVTNGLVRPQFLQNQYR